MREICSSEAKWLTNLVKLTASCSVSATSQRREIWVLDRTIMFYLSAAVQHICIPSYL